MKFLELKSQTCRRGERVALVTLIAAGPRRVFFLLALTDRRTDGLTHGLTHERTDAWVDERITDHEPISVLEELIRARRYYSLIRWLHSRLQTFQSIEQMREWMSDGAP